MSFIMDYILAKVQALCKLYMSNLICIERSADVLLNACKDIGLAVNTGETKYMEIAHHRGIIANAHFKIGINYYEKVKIFKYYSG